MPLAAPHAPGAEISYMTYKSRSPGVAAIVAIPLVLTVMLLLPFRGKVAAQNSPTSPPTNASLSGAYAFQLSNSQPHSWTSRVSVACGNGVSWTFTGSGDTFGTEVMYGTLTFDGNGNVTGIDGNKLVVRFDRAGEKRVVDSYVQRV